MVSRQPPPTQSTVEIDSLATELQSATLDHVKSLLHSVLTIGAELTPQALEQYYTTLITAKYDKIAAAAKKRSECVFDPEKGDLPPPALEFPLSVRIADGYDCSRLRSLGATAFECANQLSSIWFVSRLFGESLLTVDIVVVPIFLKTEKRWIVGLVWPRRLIVQVLDPCQCQDSITTVFHAQVLSCAFARLIITESRARAGKAFSNKLANFDRFQLQDYVNRSFKILSAKQSMVPKCAPSHSGLMTCLLIHSLLFDSCVLARSTGGQEENRLSRAMPIIAWETPSEHAIRAHVAQVIASGSASRNLLHGTASSAPLIHHLLFKVDVSKHTPITTEKFVDTEMKKFETESETRYKAWRERSTFKYNEIKKKLEAEGTWVEPIVPTPVLTDEDNRIIYSQADKKFPHLLDFGRERVDTLAKLGFPLDVAIQAAQYVNNLPSSEPAMKRLIEKANELIRDRKVGGDAAAGGGGSS